MTILYKAIPRYREIMKRQTGKKISKYNINYSDDDAESVVLDNYGSSSSESYVSNSRRDDRSPIRERSRSRGKKRKTRRGRKKS